MSVSFFYPLAWLGAAAIAAPLWLHLHRRHESNLVLFSALQFLEDQPVARRRPLWPRDLLLLMARVLAVLLLAAAFAWPYLPVENEPPLVTESVVYVLDNTLSHQAADKFVQARDQLAARLRSAGPGRQTAVVELTALPRVIAGFADSPADAASRVAELQPSIARGSYLAAMRQADELLKRSLGATRSIQLFTDNQANQWQEGNDVAPFLVDVRVQVEEPEASAALANLAIWNPQAQRLFVGDTSLVQCVAQVFHQGSAPQAELEWLVDGQTIGRETLSLAKQPEVISVAVDWESPTDSWLRGEIRLSGAPDALAADNRVFFSLPPIREGKVEVAAGSRFLQTALQPDVLRGRWQVRKFAGDEEPSADAADVMVAETSQLKDNASRQKFLDHLNGGGGALLVMDQIPPGVVGFLKDLGLEADEARALPRAKSEIRYFYGEHPLFFPFQTGEFGNLSRLRVFRYFPTRVEKGVPLMFAEDGEPVFWQVPAKGTLFVAAFALDRESTDWPLLTSFVPFLDMCLTQARPAPPSLEAYQPGETCAWEVGAESDVDEVTLRGDQDVLASAHPQNGTARLTLPERAGLYTVHYDGADAPAGMLQVNPSREESQLTYTSPEELLARWMLPKPERQDLTVAVAAASQGEASILRQRVWWWLLLGGIAMLCVETGWLAWRKERR